MSIQRGFLLERGEDVALTAKQQAWVDFYKQGKTAAEAARLAGYRGDNHDVIGAQNLVKLSAYIKDRDKLLETPRIADMLEVNEFWTKIMRSDEEKTADRIKASELRARCAGAFTDKVEHTGGLKLEGAAGGLDLSKLTDGELEALDGLLKKLHPEPPA